MVRLRYTRWILWATSSKYHSNMNIVTICGNAFHIPDLLYDIMNTTQKWQEHQTLLSITQMIIDDYLSHEVGTNVARLRF